MRYQFELLALMYLFGEQIYLIFHIFPRYHLNSSYKLNQQTASLNERMCSFNTDLSIFQAWPICLCICLFFLSFLSIYLFLKAMRHILENSCTESCGKLGYMPLSAADMKMKMKYTLVEHQTFTIFIQCFALCSLIKSKVHHKVDFLHDW